VISSYHDPYSPSGHKYGTVSLVFFFTGTQPSGSNTPSKYRDRFKSVNMCTTTFVRYYCNDKKCDYLIKYKQSEAPCDEQKRSPRAKCKIEIDSRDEYMGSKEYPKCIEAMNKKAKEANWI
jgi:hypothetical protein